MPAGNIAFNVRDQMTKGETYDVELVMSQFLSQKRLSLQLDSLLGQRNVDSIESATIKVDAKMEALLAGQYFGITTVLPVEQYLNRSGYSRWAWEVSPTSTGTLYLVLNINAIVKIEGSEERLPLETYRREIKVSVGPGIKDIINEYNNLLLLIIPNIVVFAAAWYGYRLQRRHSEKKEGDTHGGNNEIKVGNTRDNETADINASNNQTRPVDSSTKESLQVKDVRAEKKGIHPRKPKKKGRKGRAL